MLWAEVRALIVIDVDSDPYSSPDELSKSFSVALQDGSFVMARVGTANIPPLIIEAEVATMKFIRERTSIPLPQVLAYELDPRHPLGPHVLSEKVPGVRLEAIFDDLPPQSQDLLVAQIAKYVLEVSRFTFPAIGSLKLTSPNALSSPPASPTTPMASSSLPPIGPLAHPAFYIDGRASLPLARGPFDTVREYFDACAQRELDSTRALFTQGAPPGYQREFEEAQLQVERSVGLLSDLIKRCDGLDADDKALSRFSLDLHELGLKNIVVSEEDPTKIVSIVDWQSITTRPLWRCARLPYWLLPSLSGQNDDRTQRLAGVYTQTIAAVDGPASDFLRALESDDTRHALDEVAEYDVFRDGFLVLPTLQSIIATLPGEEDMDGLKELLDPDTLTGRAARISLTTTGSNALFLAMSRAASRAASRATSPLVTESPIGWGRRAFRPSMPPTPIFRSDPGFPQFLK
ncbi:hypothetical protein FA95DRAFT_1206179 [Auriscalpium vulgare]|uniref:Uncharacterized protein n=1 Tax=Auriscalpium vulgare TaxID=40419 RepID=A0ACB8R344_9AGAM|nr:hypothetical protein FA95DRAFT_1206179 [Auriscalpium vulgare]